MTNINEICKVRTFGNKIISQVKDYGTVELQNAFCDVAKVEFDQMGSGHIIDIHFKYMCSREQAYALISRVFDLWVESYNVKGITVSDISELPLIARLNFHTASSHDIWYGVPPFQFIMTEIDHFGSILERTTQYFADNLFINKSSSANYF